MRYALPALACALSAVPLVARAHLPHQAPTPFPYRCPQQGICLQSTEDRSLIGGVRQADSEVRFHAVYRPAASDGNDAASDGNQSSQSGAKDEQSKDSPWCVALVSDFGTKLLAKTGGASCDDLDLAAPQTFGVKPTGTEDALSGDDAAASDDDAATDEDADEQRSASTADADSLRAMLTQIVEAQPQPEHPEAWQQVVALARKALAEQIE